VNGSVPTTAWFVRRIIAYRPLLYAGNALCWILFHLWPLLPGVLAKTFINLLAGTARVGLNLSTLAALAVAAGAARAAIVLGAHLTGTPWRFATRELLQRNLVAGLLNRTGTPVSAGEAISTLRDDVAAAQEAIDLSFDMAAFCLFVGSALWVLFSVDARVTALVFLPVSGVIGMAHAARVRLVRLREQSRVAGARVTATIGDIFGAAQAIQAAGAADRAVAHLRRVSEDRQRAALRDRLQGLWLDGIFQQTANLGAGLVLLAAAGRMIMFLH
jgi:ATP-binding cassette subfamily B protein